MSACRHVPDRHAVRLRRARADLRADRLSGAAQRPHRGSGRHPGLSGERRRPAPRRHDGRRLPQHMPPGACSRPGSIPKGHGSDRRGIGARLAGVGSGLVHFGFGLAAVRLAAGGHGGGDASKSAADTALHLPGGELHPLCGGGGVSGRRLRCSSARRGSSNSCAISSPAPPPRPGSPGSAASAIVARGIVFGLTAWLFYHAAQAHSSGAAGGVDEALGSLPRPLQMTVAAGLVLFGLFSLVEARFRRIAAPDRVPRPSLSLG